MSSALVTEAMVAPVRIGELSGIRAAAEALRDLVSELCGLRAAISHNIAIQDPMRDADGAVLASEVFGFRGADARWWKLPQLALFSPLASACRVEAEPFWCNGSGFHSRTANPMLNALDLSRFMDRALTAAAIVVPIHLPFGQIGAASFLSPDPVVDDLSREYALYGETLALYARIFVQSYVKVTSRQRYVAAGATLTKREVECLRWAAAGKTNDEIGMILGLQRTTIRFHIRAASEKLDAVNRDQAVFKAAQLGFLGMMR